MLAVMPLGMSASVRPESPLTLELVIATPESLSMRCESAMLLAMPPEAGRPDTLFIAPYNSERKALPSFWSSASSTSWLTPLVATTRSTTRSRTG